MSRSGNQYQAQRWLLTAEEDLRAAEALLVESCAKWLQDY